jgi:hypothetical protein
MLLAVVGLSGSVLLGCAEKKKSKSSGDPAPSQDVLYSASLVLPISGSSETKLSLMSDVVTAADVTTFDSAGNQIETYSAPVKTDAADVSTVDLMVDPTKITTVEVPGKDLGVLLQATGQKPSESIQRPFTASGKNVVAALKAIPADRRPFLDPEVIGTILPAETKFDPATMKDMVLAFAEKAREIPQEKREQLFLKRLEQKTDYKDIIKSKGNLETAQAAEAAAARRAFVEKNPELAQSNMMRFLEKPSDMIQNDKDLERKIPEVIKEKVSGEALSRQILARQVSVANRALKTEEIIEMTDAMADVKAAVFIARKGANVGSKESMTSVIDTISKRALKAQKPEDIKSEALFAVLMNVPELSDSFESKREEVASMMCMKVVETLVNSKNLKECRKTRDSCEAMKLRKDGWRSSGETRSDCFNPDGPAPVQPEPKCEPEFIKMFNPRTAECQIAPNACVSKKLISFGWRARESGDTCKQVDVEQRICLMYVSHWKQDGACKFARNSCEAGDFEKLGFAKVDHTECSQDNSDMEVLPPIAPAVCHPIGAIMIHTVTGACAIARTTCDEFRLGTSGFVSRKLTECPPVAPQPPPPTSNPPASDSPNVISDGSDESSSDSGSSDTNTDSEAN